MMIKEHPTDVIESFHDLINIQELPLVVSLQDLQVYQVLQLQPTEHFGVRILTNFFVTKKELVNQQPLILFLEHKNITSCCWCRRLCVPPLEEPGPPARQQQETIDSRQTGDRFECMRVNDERRRTPIVMRRAPPALMQATDTFLV